MSTTTESSVSNQTSGVPAQEQEDRWELGRAYLVVLWTFGVTLALVIIGGNTLLVAAIAKFSKLQTRTNMAVVSLAAADILAGVVLLLHASTAAHQHHVAEFSLHLCHLMAVLQVLPLVAGYLHLSFMSVDRLVAITRAVHYPDSLSSRRIAVYVVGIWVYTFAISAVSYAFLDQSVTPRVCDVTTLSRGYMMLIVLGHAVPCSALIIGMFAWVHHTLRVHQRKIQVTNTMTYNNMIADMDTARLFFISFLATLLISAPFLVTQIVWYTTSSTTTLALVLRSTFLVVQFAYIKFIVYIIENGDFRRAIKKTLLCTRPPPNIPPKRHSKA